MIGSCERMENGGRERQGERAVRLSMGQQQMTRVSGVPGNRRVISIILYPNKSESYAGLVFFLRVADGHGGERSEGYVGQAIRPTDRDNRAGSFLASRAETIKLVRPLIESSLLAF
jgi:hypothetical protein